MKEISRISLMAIIVVVVFLVAGACFLITTRPTPTLSPPPTPSSAPTPKPTMPRKLIPAYSLDITFPSKKLSVTIGRGESVTLPVAIKSLVDEPMKIRLALKDNYADAPLPWFITYEVEGYMPVNPHETVHTQMTIKVSEDAQPGKYRNRFVLYGELEKPVKERAGAGYVFSLVVDSSTPISTPTSTPIHITTPTQGVLCRRCPFQARNGKTAS